MNYRYGKYFILLVMAISFWFGCSIAEAATKVELVPSSIDAGLNEIVDVEVLASNFINLYSTELHLQYDPLAL